MADPQQHHELIIVRRHEDEEHDHHSSAWKVAHADFMTAMMAFFLIMWLINVTDEEVKKSIANYFNPVKLSASVTDRKGLNDPEEVTPQGPEKPGDDKTTLTRSNEDTVMMSTLEKSSAEGAEKAAEAEYKADSATEAEQAAFSDPYATLDKLAAELPSPEMTSADVAIGEDGLAGAAGGEVYRDPFDPAYWQMRPAEEAKTRDPAATAGVAGAIPSDWELDVAAPSSADASAPGSPPLSDPVAELRRSVAAAEDETEAADIGEQLAASLKHSLGPQQALHVEVKATPEGILISLTDDINFSMFEIGSAIPKPIVVVAMDKVADVLAARPGNIVIRGHTDGRPFRSGTYDNWRLSTARAHMAYYMLTRGKLPESRIVRIEGFADRDLKNPNDPNAAENRRIEILLQEAPE